MLGQREFMQKYVGLRTNVITKKSTVAWFKDFYKGLKMDRKYSGEHPNGTAIYIKVGIQIVEHTRRWVLFRVRKDTYMKTAVTGPSRMDGKAHTDLIKEWYDGQQPTEELTPEGVQYVLPGAERETKPSKESEQGTLWTIKHKRQQPPS